MTIFDIILIAICAVLGVKGFVRGLVAEVVGLIALVVGVMVASRNAAEFGRWISSLLGSFNKGLELNEATSYFVGLFVLFLTIFLVIVAGGKLLSKIVKLSGLGVFDRIGGATFSVMKLVCVVAILIAILTKFDILENYIQETFSGSLTFKGLKNFGEVLMKMDYNEILDNAILQNRSVR